MHGHLNKIKRVVKLATLLTSLVDRLSNTFGVLAITVIAILMFLGILTRLFFDTLIPFQSHIMLGLLVWLVILLIGSVGRENQHIRIGTLSGLLFRKQAALITRLLEDLLAVPLCVFLAWAGWQWVSLRLKTGEVIHYSATGSYAAWIPIVCILIGFAFAALLYLERLVRDVGSFVAYVRSAKRTGKKRKGDVADDSDNAV